MHIIDNLLNRFTMYKVVLYSLFALTAYALLLSLFNLLPFNALQLLILLGIVIPTCYVTNIIFSRTLKAFTNTESWIITALILSLIIFPPSLTPTISSYLPIIIAGVLAMASKYILAFRKKHFFNPAAISLVILGLFGYGVGSWWIGSPLMLPVTLITGFLIIRKIRKIHMFISFLIPATLTMLVFGISQGFTFLDVLSQSFLSWPTIFFGTVMFTEPLTTPPRKNEQLTYGFITGVLFGAQYNIGPIYSTPELALVLGNIYSYIVSYKEKVFITLKEKNKIAEDTYEFVFSSPRRLKFLAGQYLEWTLPHKKEDIRGDRRYFTIASSPTEENIRLGVHFNTPSSSYKKALLELKPGAKIMAGNLFGDFVLKEKDQKLVFIAGGIGITPFRSMIKFLVDNNIKKDIYLFYSCKFLKEVSYRDLFIEAEKIGVKTICVITEEDEKIPASKDFIHGRLTPEILTSHIPDYKERVYYLSGPNAMVNGYKKLLREVGVSHGNIRTDYFPGF